MKFTDQFGSSVGCVNEAFDHGYPAKSGSDGTPRGDAKQPGASGCCRSSGGFGVNAILQSDYRTSPRATASDQRGLPSRDESPKQHIGAVPFLRFVPRARIPATLPVHSDLRFSIAD